MANTVLILTEPGFGKTTAIDENSELGIEGLDPKETVIINVKGKPLSFRGWQKKYKGPISSGGNYIETTDPKVIMEITDFININRPEVINLVIDDGQYIMAEKFMQDALKTGYEKFSRLGKEMYDVINKGIKCRANMNFFFLAHEEETKKGYKMKTIGKMLDEKVSLEGLFSVLLFGNISVGDDKKITKQFVTNADGVYNSARSPYGMFKEIYIPNDLGYIARKIKEYNGV